MTAHAAAHQLDSDNPWPGLEAFEEDAHDFFHGRDREIQSLLNKVLDAPVTVLYGRSGLGKTSLLRAGLFPALRGHNLLPVYVRFDFKSEAAPLVAQMFTALRGAIAAAGADAPPPHLDESLWEYLHRNDFELWSDQNYPLTPVFVLDQFEELFTLGERVPELVHAFENDFGDLADNRIPANLAARIDDDDTVAARFELRSLKYKLVISLREDFLPDLEGWRRLIPALGRSRVRLHRLQAAEAFQAVHIPAAGLMTAGLARRVVAIIAGEDLHRDEHSSLRDGALDSEESKTREVEPALLSLFCRELNEERKRRGQHSFDARLVEDAKRDILSNYYLSCVRDLPERVAKFIENQLITERGFRNSYAREDAVPAYLTDAELTQLIRQRLLRLEERYGAQRIELTHDVLTGVVREHRDRRRVEEERQAAAQREEQYKAEQRRQQAELEAARHLAQVEAAAKEQAEAHAVVLRKRTRILQIAVAVATAVALIAGLLGAMAYRGFRHATALRIATEGQAMVDGQRPGGEVRGIQQMLAAEALVAHSAGTALADTVMKRHNERKILENARGSDGAPIRVMSIAINLDGSRIASGNADSTLRLWDAETGALLGERQVAEERAIWSVAFSPDGAWIATGSTQGGLQLWDANTLDAKPISIPQNTKVRAVAISGDGQWIATGGEDGIMRIRRASTGAITFQYALAADKVVRSVAFNKAGDRLVSCGDDFVLRLWETKTGRQLDSRLLITKPISLAFSPQGDQLAIGREDGRIEYLGVTQTLTPVGDPVAAHEKPVEALAFSRDGRRMVSGSADNLIRVWDAETRTPLGDPISGHEGPLMDVAFGPDSNQLVSGSVDGSVRLWHWDQALNTPINTGQGFVYALAYSLGRVASAGDDGTVRLWNTATGEMIGTPFGTPTADGSQAARSVAFSPQGDRIVVGARDGSVWVWEIATRQSQLLRKLPPDLSDVDPAKRPPPAGYPRYGDPQTIGTLQSINSVAFSADGSWIAAGGNDGAVRIWDAVSLDPLAALGTGNLVHNVAFSPTGPLLATGSGGYDNIVQLWDLPTLQPKPFRMIGQDGYLINGLSFSSDGRFLVSASNDGFVRQWDVLTGQEITPPMGVDQNTALSVAIAPNGQWIAAGFYDNSLRLWYASGDQRHQPITNPLVAHQAPVTSVAVNEDSTRIFTASQDGTLRIWPAPQDFTQALCSKLTTRMSADQWRDWVSRFIPYTSSCPDTARSSG